MPYNPSSAYPRHTTYTPPIYGGGPVRAINAPDWAGRAATPVAASRQAAIAAMMARAGTSDPGNIGVAMAASQRQGLLGQAYARQQEAKGLKQNQRRPGQTAPAAAAPASPVPLTLTPAVAARGGRDHVAQVNDNLAAFATRKAATSGVEDAVHSVLSGTPMGTKAMPNFVFGSSRGKR